MRVDKHLLELSLAVSALAHAGAGLVLPQRSFAAPSASAPVEFVALPPPPAPRVDEPPEPEPEPEPPPAKRAAPKPIAPAPAPKPTSAEPPAELSGTTLTAEGPGTSFAAPTGDGSERREPIQSGTAPASAPPPKPSAPATAPAPKPATSTVPLPDLARRPEPPALAGTLARHYPEDARRRGVGGQAVVRARVDSDGKVRTASVVSESEPGFGAACQRTLIGSKWSPPMDREGRPVGTWVRYTCRFRVGL
ncbi:MAG: energy transducer TonB [Myxococcales bacterium]|nr:energy transducer TonB [Myxococcales bacterium]